MKLSKTIASALVAVLMLSAASIVNAQMPKTFKRVVLLVNKQVQSELKLSDSQVSSVKEQFGDAIQADDKSVRIMITPETDLDQIEKGAIKVLSDSQRNRLNQIWMQEDSYLALAAPELKDLIKVDKEHAALIDKEIDSYQVQIQDFYTSHGPVSDDTDAKKLQAEAEVIQGKANAAIKKLLSEAQLKAWDTSLGSKFDRKKS